MSSICPSEEEQLQAEMYETLMIAYGQNNTIYNHTSKNNQTPKLAQTLKQKKDNKISSGPPKYDLNRKKFSNLNNSLKNNVTHLDGLEYMINTALTEKKIMIRLELNETPHLVYSIPKYKNFSFHMRSNLLLTQEPHNL